MSRGLIISDWEMSRGAEKTTSNLHPGSLGCPMTASQALCRYMPVPNRLVILRSTTPHRVEPVHGRAGVRTRNTITGCVKINSGENDAK